MIENCSVISRQFNTWLGKADKTKIGWTDEMLEFFEKLKEAVTRDVQLTHPDYSKGAESLDLPSGTSKFRNPFGILRYWISYPFGLEIQ